MSIASAIKQMQLLARFYAIDETMDELANEIYRALLASRVCISCGAHQSDDGTLPCDH